MVTSHGQEHHPGKGHVAKVGALIHASTSAVWNALTDPTLVKQYLFGATIRAEWRVGGAITWTGEWQGARYEDKGQILELEPGSLLVTTYWSSMSGTPDVPANYKTVRYELHAVPEGTRLTITQDNNRTEMEADHAETNWQRVMEGLAKVVEDEGTARA
jgi:uncharacterized protein YndB with AHSA1/START domain